MCKIYTLRKPMGGERGDALNGKLLNIFMSTDDDKKVLFRDAVSGDNLWITTQVVIPPHPTSNGDGIEFVTSGANYDLINVESLIPTTKAVKKVVKADPVPSPVSIDPTKTNLTLCSLTEKEASALYINTFDVLNKKIIDSFDKKGIKKVEGVIEYLKQEKKFSAILSKVVLSLDEMTETERLIINCLRFVGYKIDAVYPDDSDFDDDDCMWEVKGFERQDFKSSLDLKVIFVLTEYKGINYSDGYDKTMFTFDRDLTESEFTKFLNENNYRIHEPDGWWDDYSKVEGNGKKWVYTWVRTYTD